MTIQRPTLAVIIPNYNYARYLECAVDSALDQEVPFDEIVVIDDGSTDNSLTLLKHYGTRIKVVRIPNGGVLGACRAGIAATTSDYIFTLDADDFAAPTLVKRIRPALALRPAKVQFQLRGVDDDGKSLRSSFPTFPPGYDAKAMRHDNVALGFYICPPSSGNVFGRDALSRMDMAAFDPRGAFDRSPALALPYVGEVISLNEPLAFYRVHDGSMSMGYKPTTELLNREIALFEKSWDEVVPALGLPAAGFKRDGSLFVRERRLMIACLNQQRFVGLLAAKFVRQLWSTHLTLKQKILLNIWALALVIPSRRLKNHCIRMRRSAVNRPRSVQVVIAFIMGMRRVRNA